MNIPPEGVNVVFSSTCEIDQYILLEVEKDMLDELTCTPNHHYELRGAINDEAVLVSLNKTYSIRLVETSNTVLLVQDEAASMAEIQQQTNNNEPLTSAQPQRLVQGVSTHHFELAEISPKTHILRELLMNQIYAGNDEEDATNPDSKAMNDNDQLTYYTTDDIRKVIQASDEQICKQLLDLPALELNGYWRMLHPDYYAQLLDSVLDTIVASRMNHEMIDAQKCVGDLNELYPEAIIRHGLRCIAYPVNNFSLEGSSKLEPFETLKQSISSRYWRLSAAQVCKFRAQQLFLQQEPFPDEEFVEQLKNNVPFGMSVDVSDLRGTCLCDEVEVYTAAAGTKNSKRKAWKYFPIHSLSPILRIRLDQLFQERKRWILEDIEPYLTNVCPPGQTVDQLLLKYARAVTETHNGKSQGVYMKR